MRYFASTSWRLTAVLAAAATAAMTIPSALERDPDGWTDLLAQAGPKLKAGRGHRFPREAS